jgi:hypothetical protein
LKSLKFFRFTSTKTKRQTLTARKCCLKKTTKQKTNLFLYRVNIINHFNLNSKQAFKILLLLKTKRSFYRLGVPIPLTNGKDL